MGVSFISALTWSPDRWNRNQPRSVLTYNFEQAVTERYDLSRNGPLQSLKFQMLQVQMSSLPHSPPVTQLPAIQWNHFCAFVACISRCTFLWTCWWGKKNQQYSGKLEFFLPHLSTETRACLLLQPPRSFVFSLCGKVLWLRERRRTHKWQPRAMEHSRAILRLLCEEQGL